MKHFLALIFIISLPIFSFSQAINTTFGKNRVQYHNDFNNWTKYETENFITYWYGKSRNIAQPVIQMAELDHDEVQSVLEHTISDKIEIIVYIDLSDQKQSNIGLEETFTSSEGRTKIQGNKMFVYFDGDHLNLRKQIKQGIAEVYLNSMLFGSNLQEIVQNALLFNLPEWFKSGIVAYAGSPWDFEIDDELRDLLEREKKYADFEKLAKDHPRVAGHSMWYFIASIYGQEKIANIIYLTKINRNHENGFLFILEDSYDLIKEDWYSFYTEIYDKEAGRFESTSDLEELKLENKKGVPVSHLELSPDGQFLAYITNKRGKSKVYVRNMETGEEKCIFKKGYRNTFQETDFNYPLISWHPSIPELCIIYEHRDIIKIRKVFVPDQSYEDDVLTQDYQRIYTLDYLDADNLIFSASKDGFSDLYLYKTKLRNSERLTNDFYDDLDARVISYEGVASILFSSNRTDLDLSRRLIDTILPIENFDLYVLKGLNKNKELIQITNTGEISERYPLKTGSNEIYFLSSESGVKNTYSLNLKTKEQKTLTNLERNIILHNTVPDTDDYLIGYYHHGNYKTFLKKKSKLNSVSPQMSIFKQSEKAKTLKEEVQIPLLLQETEEVQITEGMKFQSEFSDPENLQSLDSYTEERETSSVFNKYFKDYYSASVQEGKRVIKYSPMRANAARIKFRLADFTSKLDNSVLFEGLESYTGDDKELSNPPMGILFKATAKDLFEDYEMQIGLRIPTVFNGYEYFVTFDNKKYLWDKRIAIYRRAETTVTDPTVFPVQREKRHTVLGMYQLKYPFDIYSSLRLTGSLRFDKYFRIAVDPVSLNEPLINEKRISLKAEYIFDNTLDVSINIKNGTRYKAYAEVINEFNLEFTDGVNIDLSQGYTTVFGFDARHYIPVFKQAVLALRGTGATSLGSRRIVYYLGGMENWMFNQFDESIPLPDSESFSYKVLAPHLRGFKNNIRNGNSYLLSNVELRLPIFRFLSKNPNGSSFFKNFQVTGFFDAGFAWYGLGPNAEDNPLNTIEVANPPDNPVVTIEARYFRDPLVMGYGFGFRSTLLGYFLKFDYAWGVETGFVQEPRYYFSLGTDF